MDYTTLGNIRDINPPPLTGSIPDFPKGLDIPNNNDMKDYHQNRKKKGKSGGLLSPGGLLVIGGGIAAAYWIFSRPRF